MRSPLVLGLLAVGIGAAAFLVFALTGAGDDSAPEATSLNPNRVLPAATAGADRAVDLSKRPGGLLEGAVAAGSVASDAPARRFPLPLSAHAGIEDYFGTSRLYGQVHGGVDFSLVGLGEAPVLSVCDGTLTDVAESTQLGLHVLVDCGNGWEFVAGFLNAVEPSAGAALKAGAGIGSGAPGGHLHVELRFEGNAVDPANHMDLPRRVVVPPTPTSTPTDTPNTPTPRPTATPRATSGGPVTPATPTSTATAGPTATPTATPTVTNTPTITPTPTWTPTPTRTPIARPPTPTPPPVSR